MTQPSDLPVMAFPDRTTFEAWLDAARDRSGAVRQAGQGPGIPITAPQGNSTSSAHSSLTQVEMVEPLLCYGWIDGRINRLDDRHFLTRVTPRRRKSPWSQKNLDTVEALTLAGRMRPAGLAAVAAARADGRWERAYAGSTTITVPDRFAEALAAEPSAQREFERLDGANRYAVLWCANRRQSGDARQAGGRPGPDARGGPPHPLIPSPPSSPHRSARRRGGQPTC